MPRFGGQYVPIKVDVRKASRSVHLNEVDRVRVHDQAEAAEAGVAVQLRDRAIDESSVVFDL